MQDTDLPEKIEPTSLNLQTELATQLAELVPEAMSDGKLDVTKLREMVNGDAENSPEKFGLFWPGKRAAQALAQIPTTATLVPAPDESVDWDTTKNIFIEGDNLEVLKALQNSYRRKVKMIYIDPPYNTGKEFIYPDKFSEGLQGYLEYTGQKNEAGENVESKPETGGRKHSNWLSMMYPRLQLAKSLLTDNGVICISIDYNELPNLIKVCDEVFGEDNFIGTFLWNKSQNPPSLSKTIRHKFEYVLCYSRNRYSEGLYGGTASGGDSPIFNGGNNIAQLAFPAKSVIFNIKDGLYKAGKKDLIELLNDVTVIDGINQNEFRLKGQFRWVQSTLDNEINSGTKIIIKSDKFAPRYSRSGDRNITPSDVISMSENNVDTNERGRKELEAIDLSDYFDFPKPTSLIKYLANMVTVSDKDALVLDFFSGSGTTADAIMRLNAEDGGNRIHIQVQLPEKTDTNSAAFKAGFMSIADISKERIRRASKKIQEDYAEKIAKRSNPLDTGFRVYKLAPSNFVQWDENKAKDDIQQSVLDFAANKKPDAAPESLLTEIMLQARMPLSANIEKRDLQNGGWVYVVDGGNLIAYVAEEQITEAQANEIADLAPAKLIVLDSAFNGNNALKINVMNICKEKFIKEFKTI